MRKITVRPLLGITAVIAALLTPATVASPATAAPVEAPWTQVAAGPQPEANPLKGFIPFRGDFDTFPHSMEWSYFPVNAVFTAPGTFDWTVVDNALEEIRARGHQTNMRFYLDLPGQPSGLPDYLLDGNLVATRPYNDYDNNGISVSPDYDDPDLRAAMTEFITALGARYDGDPRLGFLHVGLIGFWGEWHTYPYNGEGQPNWMASEATQSEVLNAFDASFDETPLEVRYPTHLNRDLPIGYHDDSFAFTTMTSDRGWHFMDEMLRQGTQDKWREHSIGGELRPEIQLCLFTPTGCVGADRPDPEADYDFAGSVEQTHATWMMNHRAFTPGYDATTQATAIAASQSLGYAFRVTQVHVPTTAAVGTTASPIGVEVANEGVAPFYRDWPITLSAVDANGAIAWTQEMPWLVSDIPSGESRRFTATVDLSALPAGEFRFVAQVTNPMEGGMPVRFGNAAQDSTIDGWLTLGATTLAVATGAGTGTNAGVDLVSGAPAVLAQSGGPSSAPLALAGLGVVAAGIALTLLRTRRLASSRGVGSAHTG